VTKDIEGGGPGEYIRGQQIIQPDLSALMINDLETGKAVARIVAGKSRNEPPDRSIPPLAIIHPPSTAQMARERPEALHQVPYNCSGRISRNLKNGACVRNRRNVFCYSASTWAQLTN